MTRLIPAAGYLRRSTRKQEKSLADQRREIERYAERHGYQIVRWYQDDGISGDATEKRLGFQQMHRDGCEGSGFEVIICWDQDRFGRFNSLEAGYWIHPLMKAGVRLVTVADGPVNWDDFAGRIIAAVTHEGKHQFLVDLSRNTARGQITNARNGYSCGQAAPYGMDRMLVDEAGEHKQRVRNGERFAKPRSWHVTFVPSDDPEKVKTLKWLFKTYADQDVGLRTLANKLNARGVPGPRGGTWHVGTIREILKNPLYTGDFVWAQRRLGKYHRVAGGEIKARNGDTAVKRNDPAEWIGKPGAHQGIVDREVWQRVQAKLAERRKRTSSYKGRNRDAYLLTGLVFCGHCGAKMVGQKKTRRKKRKAYIYRQYICSTYHTQGKEVCKCHSVDQGALLRLLLRKLQEAVLAGGHRGELRRRVLERLEARQRTDPAELESLASKVADLDRQIDHGTRRLLRAPDDVADLLGAELSRTRRDRDRLAAELADLDRTEAVDVEAEADAAVDRLWGLAEELQDAEPTRLRELIRRMVARIDLRFDHVDKGSRVECPFSNGTIDLRPDPVLCTLVNRGDWI